ncbi:hypothetical protein RYH80_12790 [Halobaculum sp. MBLA0147]|uniref:hypothetical protein n=1 Tax=Halobaculum sp. MBLA0147 TaxID=3079934 RepID=UPI003524AFC9
MNRRRLLSRVGAFAGAVATGTTAGCLGLGADTSEDAPTVNPVLDGTPTQSPTATPPATTWSVPAGGAVPPVVLGGHVVTATGPPAERRVVGLDPADGRPAWRRAFDPPLTVDTDGRLLSVASEVTATEPFGELLDPRTGRRLWRTDHVIGVAASRPGRAVVRLWRSDGRGPDEHAVLEAVDGPATDGTENETERGTERETQRATERQTSGDGGSDDTPGGGGSRRATRDAEDRGDRVRGGEWREAWRVRGRPRLLGDGRVVVTRLADDFATVEGRRVADGSLRWRRRWATDEGLWWVGALDTTALVGVAGAVRALALSDGHTRDTIPEPAGGVAAATVGGATGVVENGRRYLGRGLIGDGSGGGGVVAFDEPAGRFVETELGAPARPVAAHEGPIVQFADGRRRWVAAYTPTLSTRRWRRAGTAVAVGERGPYLVAGDRLVALDTAGRERWTVRPRLGDAPADVASLTEWDFPRIVAGDAVVTTGPRGVATYAAVDGTERTRVTGVSVGELLPRSRLGPTTPLAGNVFVVGGGAIHAVPV